MAPMKPSQTEPVQSRSPPDSSASTARDSTGNGSTTPRQLEKPISGTWTENPKPPFLLLPTRKPIWLRMKPVRLPLSGTAGPAQRQPGCTWEVMGRSESLCHRMRCMPGCRPTRLKRLRKRFSMSQISSLLTRWAPGFPVLLATMRARISGAWMKTRNPWQILLPPGLLNRDAGILRSFYSVKASVRPGQQR